MPLLISCKECGSQLKLPDTFAGRRGRCPRCASVFDLATAAAAAPAPRRAVAPRTAVTDEAPRGPVAAEDWQPEAAQGTELAPRRKKKKRKKKEADSGVPVWVWWLLGGAGGAVCMLAFFIVMFLTMRAEALIYFIVLLVLLPISTVIFIVSMFISSAVGGGIDFGDARVAIPKAIALIMVVNTVGLTCGLASGFGGFLMTGPVWLFGLMGLYRLDLWEARLVVAINWGLNCVARIALLTVVASLFTAGGGGGGFGGGDDGDDDPPDQIAGVQMIKHLGGKVQYDNALQQTVVEVDLSHSRVTDEDLDALHEFQKLRVLDLSGTRVTDVGLQQLVDLTELQQLNLSQTAVSKAGVKKLQRALPNLQIIR
jgi:hypothetical protein